MRHPKTLWMLPVLVTGLLTLTPAWHRPSTEVDLALVLAVDVSISMDSDEQALQRQGYVEAFRSPLVHQAIRTGTLGRIAVTYVEWAGTHPHFQKVIVPWVVLDDPKDSISFADRLAHTPIHRAAGTSISEVIDFSMALFSSGHFRAARQVIDISGDGSNNQGRLVTEARDDAIARGVTINGLPLLLKVPDRHENATIDAYYRDCVIGGSGAFMIPIREPGRLLTETRNKIVREIAGVEMPSAPVQPVQGESRTDCDTSESLWDEPVPEAHPPASSIGQRL
ncbi:DUF1194 domain-containing protein [Microvirga sp. G4-2]|uniref:DUF1194 domain-containing protein n=1 Tax=Microvirga sp. G4-2 TaxID=3434467 RepID=UPI004043C5C1